MFVSRITLFVLPALAAASALLPRDPSCNTGVVQCCASTQSSNNLGSLTPLLVSLGINVNDLTDLVGVTCNPIIGMAPCPEQTVCCKNTNFNGAVALGCNTVNINL